MPAKGTTINMPGNKGILLKWISGEDFFTIQVHESQSKTIPLQYAVVFNLSQALK
jgi:hypothetical protein